jgi:ELWxxDGT repeat protein
MDAFGFAGYPQSVSMTATGVEGELLMVLSDGTVWHTDGTSKGTRLELDFGGGAQVSPAVAALGKAKFASAYGSDSEYEVWTATQSGPWRKLSSITSAMPKYGRIVGATSADVFIAAFPSSYRTELWRTDGTAAGTRLVKALPEVGAAWIEEAFASEGRLYFFARSSASAERGFWQSDGTPGGTIELATGLSPLYEDLPFRTASMETARRFVASSGDNAFFLARPGSGEVELWFTDGTPAGTRALIVADTWPQTMQSVGVLGNTAYFAVDNAGGTSELWISNGTVAGTRRFSDIAPGIVLNEPDGFTNLDGRLFFAAETPAAGRELWVTDGTPGGTRMVRDIAPSAAGSLPGPFAVWQNRIYFCAASPRHGAELWTSDGTTGGTSMVSDMVPGMEGGMPIRITPAGGKLYFIAFDYTYGAELRVLGGQSGPGGDDSGCVIGSRSENPGTGVLLLLLGAMLATVRFKQGKA